MEKNIPKARKLQKNVTWSQEEKKIFFKNDPRQGTSTSYRKGQ